MPKPLLQTTGRRKESVARVRFHDGSGQVTLNGRSLEDYFPTMAMRLRVMEPITLTQMQGRYDIDATLEGGGTTGQVDALRLGISRALISLDPELRPTLKKAGMLTRDSRVVESKKYGLRKARSRSSVHQALDQQVADLRRLLDDGKPIFGTDGVRGVAGSELTPELAMSIGRAAGSYLRGGPVLVGRDTRRSGSMLSSALQSGFHASGIDTIDVGVLPSGGISHLTAVGEATMGAIVSASHNPADDNGIKLLAGRGTKLPDEVERELEDRLRSTGSNSAVGPTVGYRRISESAMNDYIAHLVELSRYSLSSLQIALDCAHGSAYQAAPELFARLKADVVVYAAEPDGTNINAGVGATHPEFLVESAAGRIGFAFDGDADRLIAIDEDGKVANGDVIMAIVARHMKSQGKLKRNLVVATVMSNIGFKKSMAEAEIEVVETKVGDRYVMEALLENKGILGGEQSGHIIFTDHGQSGDGLLTAVQLLNVVAGTGKELRELRADAITEYPQILENVLVDRMVDLSDAESLWDEVRDVEEELGDEGRVLIRPSGTEPVVRVMVEASSERDARRYADRLATVTRESLGKE